MIGLFEGLRYKVIVEFCELVVNRDSFIEIFCFYVIKLIDEFVGLLVKINYFSS